MYLGDLRWKKNQTDKPNSIKFDTCICIGRIQNKNSNKITNRLFQFEFKLKCCCYCFKRTTRSRFAAPVSLRLLDGFASLVALTRHPQPRADNSLNIEKPTYKWMNRVCKCATQTSQSAAFETYRAGGLATDATHRRKRNRSKLVHILLRTCLTVSQNFSFKPAKWVNCEFTLSACV